jgi:hypothetical protein
MKKIILSLSIILLAGSITFAQDKKHAANSENATTATTTDTKSSLKPENVVFKTDVHDFGSIQEGPAAEFEFQFTNTGSEPLVIQKAQASCGCTTPHYSKDPVLPGKDGVVMASYNTNGRPGPFTKTITITSNAGTKVVTIKGTVEKAPTTSVPQNSSLIKTN